MLKFILTNMNFEEKKNQTRIEKRLVQINVVFEYGRSCTEADQ